MNLFVSPRERGVQAAFLSVAMVVVQIAIVESLLGQGSAVASTLPGYAHLLSKFGIAVPHLSRSKVELFARVVPQRLPDLARVPQGCAVEEPSDASLEKRVEVVRSSSLLTRHSLFDFTGTRLPGFPLELEFL